MWPLVGGCWKVFPPPQFTSNDLAVISITAGIAGCASQSVTPRQMESFIVRDYGNLDFAPRSSLRELRSHCRVSSLRRTAGAAPLLAWNRMLQAQNQYQPGQFQGLGGPMGYPQRPEDRMDRGRQVRKPCPGLCVLFRS